MPSVAGMTLTQLAGLAVIVVTLLQAAVALLSRLQNYRHRQQVHRHELASFAERLAAEHIRRVDRGSEANTWNGFRKFRVNRKQDEGASISSFYLEPHDGKAIPSFKPGQFLTFQVNVAGETKPVRPPFGFPASRSACRAAPAACPRFP